MNITRRTALVGALAMPAIRVASAAEPLTYLYPAPSFLPAFVPHRLAESRGYFAAAGLAVTTQTGRGGADVAKQVGVGNMDLGGGMGETSMIVRANGVPVKGVALLGGKSLYQIAVRQSLGLKSIADLRGKKVGVIGYQDTGYFDLLGTLSVLGIHKADLQIQAVGPAGMTQLMIAGSLDAIASVPEWGVMIEDAGTKLDYFPIDGIIPSMAQAVVASDSIIAKRPKAIKAFVGALLRSVRECAKDPAAAAKDFAAITPQQAGKEAQIERILRRYAANVWAVAKPADLGRFDPQRLAKMQKIYLANELIEKAVPIPELYTNEFVG